MSRMITIKKCAGSGTSWHEDTQTPVSYEFDPKSLKVNIETIAKTASGRMSDGYMNIDYLRTDIRKLEIEFPPYKKGVQIPDLNYGYGTIMNAVPGHVWKVTYPDPYTGADKTIYAYCSSANGDYYSGVIAGGIVQGAAFNLIEL